MRAGFGLGAFGKKICASETGAHPRFIESSIPKVSTQYLLSKKQQMLLVILI